MSDNPYWQLLGWIVFIGVFAIVACCIKYSHSLPEEDIAPHTDAYHGEQK